MSEEKEVGTLASYVIPMYAMVAFLHNTDSTDSINPSVVELMKKIDNNQQIKELLGLMSGKLTEIIAGLDSSFAATIFIPNAFIPIKEQKDSDLVIDFVSRLNDEIAKRMDGTQENEQ